MPQENVLCASTGSGPQLVRFTITHAELTDADTSQTINLKTLPKGSVILAVRIKSDEAFTGGSVSACTVSVGSAAGSADDFATAFDIYTTVADTTFQMSSNWKAITYAEDTLQATFTSTTDNLVNLTAGIVFIDVYVWLMTTPDTYL